MISIMRMLRNKNIGTFIGSIDIDIDITVGGGAFSVADDGSDCIGGGGWFAWKYCFSGGCCSGENSGFILYITKMLVKMFIDFVEKHYNLLQNLIGW